MIDAILNYPSASAEFKKLLSTESKKMFPNSTTYLQKYPEEYWAESLAYYTYSSKNRNNLKNKAPKTYNYFVKLIASL